MDELELAKRVSAGDHQAIDQLVETHYASIYRFLRHLTRHVDDAEDLAQQTLIRALRGAERFDGRAKLRPWLLGIAFREFTKWRRRRLWLPLTADRPKPGDDYQRLLEADALLDALGQLPEGFRATFLMHYVEGLSLREVAESLAIPEGTVKSRLHAARAQLSSLLEEEVPYATKPCQS
ncbi:MAG TPA: RNA polymerase sigma factor [Fimbriimonadaceae bacterium]|nr:RNA polymerase sigma factor [Fimbriimonadaceae bacterium]